MQRRIVCVWFPRLASDRALRHAALGGPFALVCRQKNTDLLSCLNAAAAAQGLSLGMSLADARLFCPDLITRPADPQGDRAFLTRLRRWALRYCPWVGLEDADGLVLDITGAAHLQQGEAGLVADLQRQLAHLGLEARVGLADSRGAAWALAHFGAEVRSVQSALSAAPQAIGLGGSAAPGQTRRALADLPVAALRLTAEEVTGLERLGLRRIGDLAQKPRAPLARRFGPGLLQRLDQAFGDQPEAILPLADPPHYAVRLTLPEPIGLATDVMAALHRLLVALCDKLKAQAMAARVLSVRLRRVDRAALEVSLRLAGAMREPARILPLFARQIEALDAGFGIDQLRLAAVVVEPLVARQIGAEAAQQDQLEALLTRIGARIGLENIRRYQPRDSHLPERAFALVAACDSRPTPEDWPQNPRRPLRLFAPEPILAQGTTPPQRFRWRGMDLHNGRSTGPERIAPEWWSAPAPEEGPPQALGWGEAKLPGGGLAPGGLGRLGLRDYWRVDTRQGRRLWMFYTPQNPGWYVQGEFL